MTFARRPAGARREHPAAGQRRAGVQQALLARTFAAQVEGAQAIPRWGRAEDDRPKHVHVAEGGQAIVSSNVNAPVPGGGAKEKVDGEQPHALAYAPGVEMPRQIEAERAIVPSAGGAVVYVCRMHGASGGAPKGNRNALKHGLYSAEAIEMRRIIRELTRQSRELIEMT